MKNLILSGCHNNSPSNTLFPGTWIEYLLHWITQTFPSISTYKYIEVSRWSCIAFGKICVVVSMEPRALQLGNRIGTRSNDTEIISD